jgi:hypothetical protein
VRRGGRERKMVGKRSVWVSKEGHGAAAEHALRPGEALHVRAGAGDAGGTRGGSGGGGATWRGGSRPARGLEGGGQGAGGHVARGKVARRRRVRGTWPARAAGVVQRRNRGGGLEVDEGGAICNFQKV